MNAQEISQYGWPAIVVGLAAFVIYIIKAHSHEREEWKKTTERQFEETNKTSNNTTAALTELTTLIKTLKK